MFLYGAWPQVMPLYLTYSLFYWDHNTRQAIMGFVGTGGVGYTLFFALGRYYFEHSMMVLIVLTIMVVIIDRFCLVLRRKII